MIGNGLTYHLPPEYISEAHKLFNAARTRAQSKKANNKIAVIIINSNYSKSSFTDLEGPLIDLKHAQKLFKEKGYKIHIIKDSRKINEDVLDLIEDNNLEERTEIFQLFFSGHGVFKSTAEKGMLYTGNKEKADYKQEGEYGDCLVNSDGSLCEELLLAYQVSDVLNKDAQICMFYDMCRSEQKQAPIQTRENIIVSHFDNKMRLEESGADRRMIRIFSSQLGKTSSGTDSFFQHICQHIELSSPQGVTIVEMQGLETEKQKCSIEAKPGWDNKIWPL